MIFLQKGFHFVAADLLENKKKKQQPIIQVERHTHLIIKKKT